MSALVHLARGMHLVLSYNIMCQWLRHLLEWIAVLPDHLQIELPKEEVRYAIPKYHFNGHKEERHNQFSFNLKQGIGRTDGEKVKHEWSRFDTVASSTQEMGPGSQEETLEDHMEYNNMEKYFTMGTSLNKRECTAVAGYVKFDRLHQTFTTDLQPLHVAKWTVTIVVYVTPVNRPRVDQRLCTGMSESEIQMELLQQEEEEANQGCILLYEITPASMLSTLLDLEEQQQKFRTKHAPTANCTPSQMAEVIAKRASLHHRINMIRIVQAIYMPCVLLKLALHRQSLATSTNANSSRSTSFASSRTRPPASVDMIDLLESQPLFLLSTLNHSELNTCVTGLADMESKLRDGQLADSLDKLRVHLHIHSCLVGY
ncbi:uncharacterized protein PHACADRAFT_33556 [Phanerochaete carnosa HHB-10118-sp]|uniref:Uncharacterized protein n=1 Tax=Phanerochaete carnosa (strain HHB-10118-sp) TaxID=650164 RepID=K5VDN7_PHACS|nr:uncharacterized protein PHACADRAFT_33556 [Phanerochaete carnosa HHB-10118-sp]EKM49243.1 hypothetical protein PHACADRAFT_33556 [Phanerochaete carnosa HHB-10118-sp]